MIDHGLYDDGYLVVIAPALNYHVQDAAEAYYAQLREPEDGKVRFVNLTLAPRCRKPGPSPAGELPMKVDRFDIHQHITDKIVSAIELGAGEFRLPWHCAAGSFPRPVNVASKKAYRGINILALWATADDKGFCSGVWGTYKQWVEAGAQVRQGEKAAFVVF